MSCLPSPELGKQKGKKTQNQTASIAQAFASLVLALPLVSLQWVQGHGLSYLLDTSVSPSVGAL